MLRAVVLTLLLLSACTVHRVHRNHLPTPPIPDSYSSLESGVPIDCYWWQAFEDPILNQYVRDALQNNYNLWEAWARMKQAQADLRIRFADKIPAVNLDNTERYTSTRQSGAPSFQFGIPTGEAVRHFLTPALSYEIDLWRRIDSRVCAGVQTVYATQDDMEATALTLTGTVTDLWLTLLEQIEQERLLKWQIEINRVLLELVELRFSLGAASALDVFQQRQQLAGTEAQVPSVQSLQRTTYHQLQSLIGLPPGEYPFADSELALPKLPKTPEIGYPFDLFCCRPDLRAEQRRLSAADYEIASAIADCFPKLTLNMTYEFSSASFYAILDRQVFTLILNLLTPIIDGGRRQGEVYRRRAILMEHLASYSSTFLRALVEVENALVQEKYQLEFISRLERQEEYAKANLMEARSRYANGLTDYLSVIAAVQSLQNVQRQIISERKNLLSIRAQLYRSVGGGCCKLT